MSQSNAARKAIYYCLITHGTKYNGTRYEDRPEARMQFALFKLYAQQANLTKADLRFEYLRRARQGSHFVDLYMLMSECLACPEKPVLVISDVQHLLRRLPYEKMHEFLKELAAPVDLVHDARMGRALHGLADDHLLGLAGLARSHQAGDRLEKALIKRPRNAAPSQTAAAREMSDYVRSEAADGRAQDLARVRDELAKLTPGGAPSFADIARHANARGLSTSRGRNWTSALVSRALERLEFHVGD